MRNITDFLPLAPLLQKVGAPLQRRRLAQHGEIPDGLPDYLRSDIGLSGSQDHFTAVHRAVVFEALRRF
jgi:hypothetical protein